MTTLIMLAVSAAVLFVRFLWAVRADRPYLTRRQQAELAGLATWAVLCVVGLVFIGVRLLHRQCS